MLLVPFEFLEYCSARTFVPCETQKELYIYIAVDYGSCNKKVTSIFDKQNKTSSKYSDVIPCDNVIPAPHAAQSNQQILFPSQFQS